jgi:succinoglycan biosynthesis protein ExoA
MDPLAATPPGVSIVLPVLNEEPYLAETVGRLLSQTYDGPTEIILAVAPSQDRTSAIADGLAAGSSRVRVVANPTGRTATALNLAIAAASYGIVVRVDGHAFVPDDYLAIAVETLVRTGADNVGGIMAAVGETPFEFAVARAMTTRLGVGGAAFHVGGEEGPALTVYLGAFRRSALERVGGYDESFTRAQDWEMNHRIRASGGLVWFTPRLRVTYRPRPTLRRLARQYLEYGRWRREVARAHPGTLSVRYLAPPATTVGVLGGTLAGLVGAATGTTWLQLGWLAPAGYAALVLVGSLVVSAGLPMRARLWLPAVFVTMHGSWGWGFLTSRKGQRQEES